jgi:hypothetical protein
MSQNKKLTMGSNGPGFETIPQRPNTRNGPTKGQNNVGNFGLFFFFF